jgi:uncharacterized protein (DUF433 family)
MPPDNNLRDYMAFSSEQVEKLTGLSSNQLRYWDRLGFFQPEMSDGEDVRGPYGRVYSFRDVVSLKALATLRKLVSFQEIRAASEQLHRIHDTPWASLTLYALGGRIYFEHPDTGELFAGRSAGMTADGRHALQPAMRVPMRKIAESIERRVKRWQQRSRSQIGHVEQQKYVAHNLPVLSGTRITTSAVWDFYSAGYQPEEILRQYPTLTEEDVKAAIDYELQRREPKTKVS